MPWVYRIDLSEFRTAEELQTAWKSISTDGISNTVGGVCASEGIAVAVSTPREPNFQSLETDFSYVNDVTEIQEIPGRGDAGFAPPISLAGDIVLTE